MRVVWQALAALLVTTVRAQPAHGQHEQRVSASGSTVTIALGRARQVIQLPLGVPVDMDTVEVLDSQSIHPMTYLLLTVRGPSRRSAMGAGECGAGFETAIVWLQLRDWRVMRSDSRLVESCWKHLAIDSALQMTNEEIRLHFLDEAEGSSRRLLRYDRRRPYDGISVSPTPVPPPPSP